MHKAKPAVAGQKTLILHPSNLWLTIHESVGHPDRARSRARLRGELRRHQLPDHRQAREVPVRLADGQHRRRQDAGQGDGDLRLRRRRREDDELPDHQGRHVRRLPDDARPGAPDRPDQVARLQLRRQLVVGPLPADAERVAAAEREGRHRAGHHRARPTTASTSRATAATRSITSATTSSSAARRSGK